MRLLDLYGNRLTRVPHLALMCRRLERLHLYDNALTELPPQLGQLTALRVLDVGRNCLTSLPAALFDVTTLTTLDVRDNQLRAVAWRDLRRLVRLDNLFLRGNPASDRGQYR